jgi:hypothetical protein
MGLGYEGYVKLNNLWTLGTGTSVARQRVRIDSQGGYGGKVAGASMGVGGPHAYDWTVWDGSINFDLTNAVFDTLKTWIMTDRDTNKGIEFSSRDANVQSFGDSYWTSINISAAEAAPVTGSVEFVALDRNDYVYGNDTQKENSETGPLDCEIIPYWNTKIGSYKFIEWTLAFSQDVVKLFACNNSTIPKEPVYLGIGPMSVVLTGSYILGGGEMGLAPGNLTVNIGSGSIILKKTELQDQSDDVQTGNSLTPISVTVQAYELG